MKRLLLDACTKTEFSDDNVIYQQCDGVPMGSSLAPVLANIIDEPFKLGNIYRTKILSNYCNTKYKVPEYLKSHIVYEFCCQACNSKCVGQTDRISATMFKSILVQTKATGLQSFVGM